VPLVSFLYVYLFISNKPCTLILLKKDLKDDDTLKLLNESEESQANEPLSYDEQVNF
jgi:hypothetical protein